jgi:pSer/pThr/pTyr-binding forkhead associated (FHA) protein
MQWLLRHGAREFVFRSEVVAVGRGHDVDLNLDDESVSRRHAQLRHEHGRPLVEDLQSRNGTLVNGQLIAGRAFLSIGDLVAFGSCELELLRASDVVAFAPEQATGLIGRDEVARGVLGPLSDERLPTCSLFSESSSWWPVRSSPSRSTARPTASTCRRSGGS